MEVYGASRFAQDTADAPSAVSILTREDIRHFGYRTLGEALGSVRGVFTTDDRNYTYLGVRGFARPGDYNTRVLLLVDGYRVNDNVYNTATMGSEFPIDLSLVERIEFIPGPGSALYGSNAFLGVVNVVTRKGESVGTEAAAYAASDNAGGLRLNVGRRLESGAELLVSAARERSRGADHFYPEFEATDGGMAAGLDYQRAERAFARFAAGPVTVSAGGSSRLKGIPTAAFGTAFGVPGSETRDSYAFADVRYEAAVGERTDLLARLSYNDYHYAGRYIYDAPPLVANRDRVRGVQWILETRLMHRLAGGHRLVVGVEHQRDEQVDQLNYDEDPAFVYLDDRRKGSNNGVYAETEYRLRPDLIVGAGLRHDSLASGLSSTNPRLSLIHHVDRSRTVKLLYGTAFRAPNAYERYYGMPGFGQKSNPDLLPERIRTYEAVYEQTAGRTRFAASAYTYRVEGLIDLITDPADGDRQFVNAGNVRTRGVEAEADHRLRNGLRLRGTLALQSARRDGMWLDNSPRHIATGQALVPLAGERVRLGLEARHLGARASRGSEIPSYTVLNATLTSAIARNAELRAGVYNVANRTYWDAGSDEHTQERLARDGRTVRLELDVRF